MQPSNNSAFQTTAIPPSVFSLKRELFQTTREKNYTKALFTIALFRYYPIPMFRTNFFFFFLFFVFSNSVLHAQNFTRGKIVVSRVGDGTTTLSTSTIPITLLEYDLSTANQTTPSNTLSLGSTTAGSRLTVAGATGQEGQISLSTDGNYLTIIGYDHPAGTATPNSTTVNKVIGRINNAGTVDFSTNFPSSANGSTKSVVSDDGTRFWSSINNTNYQTFGSVATPSIVASTAPRTLNIYNGQLYYHTAFGSIFSTNTALPTAASTATVAVPISPQLSSNGFVFFDTDPSVSFGNTGFDLLYLTNGSNGLEKYYFNAATSSWLPVHSQYQLVITLTNGGSGYTSTPSVTIGTTWTSGATYALNDQILGTNGRLYKVTTAGTSGAASPTHTTGTNIAGTGEAVFTHVSASPNAAATAIVSGGVVTGIMITTQQNGYLAGSTPAVTITGGGGSGATATAAIPNTVFNPASNGSLAQLTGKLINGVPTLFAVTGSGTTTANKLIKIVDNSGRTALMTNALSPTTVLATAPANTAFRGVAFSTESPQITVSSASLSGFTTNIGAPSATQNYTVNAAYLSSNLVLTAPTGYEISLSAASGFNTSLTLNHNSGVVPLTTIYVRLSAMATAGAQNGNVTHTSTGATTQNVALSGTVNVPIEPTINVSGTPTAYSTTFMTPSVNQTFTVSGTNLTNDVDLTAPSGFEISLDPSTGFGSTLLLPQTSGIVSATTIYVHLTGDVVGVVSGDIVLTSTGATSKNVAVSGTVSMPTITVTGTPLSAFVTTEGTPSVNQSYTVSGTNLTTVITLTAPTGYEISLSTSSGFGSSLTLTPTNGSVSVRTIYVRLTGIIGTSGGTPSGDITHTSGFAVVQNVAVSGTVNTVPTIVVTGTPLTVFSAVLNKTSDNQNYSVSGINLTADIVLTAPSGFEISLSGNSGFGSTLTLTQTDAIVPTTPIYVRLTGSVGGTLSGNITHTTTGGPTQNVAVNGSVNTASVVFSAGNLTVLRVGDGATALGATAAPVNLIEISTAGTATGASVTLPSAAASNFLIGGSSATQEGQLTLSGDGRFISAVGYNTALGTPQTATAPAAAMQTSQKIIARVDYNGNADISTRIPTSGNGSSFSNNSVRGAVTEDGTSFFVTATTTSRQVDFGTSFASNYTGSGAFRSIQRFKGTSYFVNFEVPGYVDATGAIIELATDAPPATQFGSAGAGQCLYLLDASPTVSFNGTGYDLLYIPDIASGIRKWYFDGLVWVYAGIVNPTSATGVTGGVYALSAKMVGGVPNLYAVKGAAANNNIVKIVDNSGRTGNWATGTAPTITTLLSAGANYMYRGLSFSPADLPKITLSQSTLTAFTAYKNAASTALSYTVSGTNLVGDVVLTAPTGFEISSTSATTGFAATLTLTPTSATITNRTIYVRLKSSTVAASFSGNITHTSTNAVTQNVAITGDVIDNPVITLTGTSFWAFGTVRSTPSVTQSYTVSAINMTANMTITAPSGYNVSTSPSSGFASSLTITPTNRIISARTIYVRMTGASTGTFSGNIAHTTTPTATQNAAVTGTVVANSNIVVTNTGALATAFSTTQGTPSATKTYLVSGVSLSANILITPPVGFEVSTSANSGFVTNPNSLTLTRSGTTVALTTIYVRLVGATVGSPSGNIAHSSTGKTTVNRAVSGTVSARPVITNSVSSLSAFSTVQNTPSVNQTFTVSGASLIANLTLTAPTGFEISTSANSGFSGSLSFTPTSGSVPTTTIYTRLTATTIGTPSGNIVLATTGAVTQNVAVSGTVSVRPVITITGTPLSNFSTRVPTPSVTQTYSVSGVDLTDNIVINAPANFEISTDATTNFSSSLSLLPTSGSVATTPIYVRLTGVSAASPTGNITNASTNATTENVPVTGVTSPFNEIIVTGTPLSAFTAFVGTPSVNQTFLVSGINLTNDITLTAPTGFEISTSANSGFNTNLTLTQTSGTVSETTIYARLTGATISTPSGNIALTSTGTTTKNVAVSGAVYTVPVITVTGTLTPFSTTLGVPTTAQSYTVSGSNLVSDVVVNAPSGFVISTSAGTGYGVSLTLTPTSGTLATQTIYVNLVETLVGTTNGNVAHTATGAVTKYLAVNGSVTDNSTAKIYYVSPDGSNSNDGLSLATPLRSLSRFSFNNTLTNPGDIIYLMNGVFGATDLAGASTGNAVLEITRSGSAGKPIRFVNYPGHTPIVQFNGWNGILIKASYIQIEGIEVRGAMSVQTLAAALAQPVSCGNAGSVNSAYQGNGINVDGRITTSNLVHPTHILIKNCKAYECGGGGIATSEADYVTIENNITYNNAWYSVYANSGISLFHAYNSDNDSISFKNIIRNNISYGNDQKVGTSSCSFTDGNGIIIDDFRNTQSSSTIGGQIYKGQTLVENNIVYNNGGRGIHAYLADNCTFRNNTTYQNSFASTPNGNEGEITVVSSNNVKVYNNIMYARTGKKLSTYSSSSNLQENNNLMFNSSTFAFFNNQDIFADPKFVDAANADFRLLATSQAIDGGIAKAGLFSPSDFIGTARPQNGLADIGAYESTLPPSVISGFTAGNIAVLRVGNGSSTLNATAANVNILEFSPSGTPSGVNIALPSAASTNFLLGGLTTVPEGQLTLSGEGRYLSAVGYNTTVGQSATTTSEKIIARIDYETTVDMTSKIPTSAGFATNTVRNAVTQNGSSFLVTANTTARQVNLGASTSATFAGGGGYNSIQQFNGKSYFINTQTPGYINDAGTAVNFTTAASPAVQFNSASASQTLALLDADPSVNFNGTGYDLLYIPDMTNGIRKWYFNGTVWVYAGVVNPTSPTSVTGGFYSISAKMEAGVPVLYAIKGAAVNNNLMKLVDNSGRTGDWSTTPPSVTTLASAGANYTFRGSAFSPSEQVAAYISSINDPICAGSNAVFNVTGTSGSTVTYNLNGGTNTTTTLTGGVATITVAAATANQTLNLVSVTNGINTQTLSSNATITVKAAPTITGTLTLNVGETTVLTGSATAAAVNPWVSATTSVATVDNAGIVTAVAAGTSVITYTNTEGCTKTATITVRGTALLLSAKVFLEGGYSGGSMSTTLANSLPTTEPYTGMTNFTHQNGGGGEMTTLNIITANNIVDWIFVELRSSGGTVYTQSALLKNNGSIVDKDGISPLSFAQANAGSYTITIKHRNHLKIKTSNMVALSASTTAIDFTNNTQPITGVLKLVASGVYALYAGDTNADGQINATDRSNTWNARNVSAYNVNDCSMNGTVDATDRSQTWNNRNLSAGF
jgi:parallel beta-helix repeat protein